MTCNMCGLSGRRPYEPWISYTGTAAGLFPPSFCPETCVGLGMTAVWPVEPRSGELLRWDRLGVCTRGPSVLQLWLAARTGTVPQPWSALAGARVRSPRAVSSGCRCSPELFMGSKVPPCAPPPSGTAELPNSGPRPVTPGSSAVDIAALGCRARRCTWSCSWVPTCCPGIVPRLVECARR